MSHPASRRKSVRGLLLLPLLLLVLHACGDPGQTRERAQGSVLWVTPEALPELGAEARETLLAAGVRELFVEAGRLADGGSGVEGLLAASPRSELRLPVTLVVHGAWAEATDPLAYGDDAGTGLAEDLASLRRTAEAKGLTVVGYHLDVDAVTAEEGLTRLADSLEALGEALAEAGDGKWLSLTVAPDSLAVEGFADVADQVDFLVPFLYGARDTGRPGPDPARAWDPAIAEAALPRLQALGKAYLLGIGTRGLLQRVDGDGMVLKATSSASLKPLIDRPDLEISFGGLDTAMRQRLLFQATEPLHLGGWRLATGDRVQVVRPAVSHLRAAARRAAEATPDLHLGQAYVRLPAADERISLGLPAIAAAAGEGEPELALEVEVVADGRGRSRLRLRLVNPGPLSSDVAQLETNYLHVHAVGGATIASIDAGGFQRYQLELDGRRVRDMRSLRRADSVRLYLPLIEAGDEVESGPLVLRGAPGDGPVLRVGGRFAVPGGGEVVLPEQVWPAPPEPEAEPEEAAAQAAAGDTP